MEPMRLGLNLGYWGGASDRAGGGSEAVILAQEADRLGYAVVWAAEAYAAAGITTLSVAVHGTSRDERIAAVRTAAEALDASGVGS